MNELKYLDKDFTFTSLFITSFCLLSMWDLRDLLCEWWTASVERFDPILHAVVHAIKSMKDIKG